MSDNTPADNGHADNDHEASIALDNDVNNDLGDTPYDRVKTLMLRLRQDCPWDRAQSFTTIAPYTIEESYEVADAIARQDMTDLKSELGDLLFQVLFHAQMASELPPEQGRFTLDDICEALIDKMVRRHPHIFAGTDRPDWEAIKHQERRDKGQTRRFDDIPLALPALMRAGKLQKRAAKTGFDWPDTDGVWDKIYEEIAEVKEAAAKAHGLENNKDALEDEIGDLFFAITNLARHHNIQAETALRRANDKFSARFSYIEDHAREIYNQDIDSLDLTQMETLWQKAKQNGL